MLALKCCRVHWQLPATKILIANDKETCVSRRRKMREGRAKKESSHWETNVRTALKVTTARRSLPGDILLSQKYCARALNRDPTPNTVSPVPIVREIRTKNAENRNEFRDLRHIWESKYGTRNHICIHSIVYVFLAGKYKKSGRAEFRMIQRCPSPLICALFKMVIIFFVLLWLLLFRTWEQNKYHTSEYVWCERDCE